MSHLQQNGYECSYGSAANNKPLSFKSLKTSLSASLTHVPAQLPVSFVNFPSPFTSCTKGKSLSLPTLLSSSPNAGAICTTPVPSVSVTYESATT